MNTLQRLLFTGGVAVTLFGSIGMAVEDDTSRQPQVGAVAIEIRPGEIANNPASFYGKKVQVSAEVEDVFSPHAFTLDEDMMFAGPDVLVLNPAPRRASKDDEEVTVTGIVRQFTRAEIERDYKWFEYRWLESSQTQTDFTTRPVLIADSVRTSAGEELVRRGDASMSAGDQPLGNDKKSPKQNSVDGMRGLTP